MKSARYRQYERAAYQDVAHLKTLKNMRLFLWRFIDGLRPLSGFLYEALAAAACIRSELNRQDRSNK